MSLYRTNVGLDEMVAREQVFLVLPLVGECRRFVQPDGCLRMGFRNHVVVILPLEHVGMREDKRLMDDECL